VENLTGAGEGKNSATSSITAPGEEKKKKYDLNRPWLTLDNWQKEYINERKMNCFLQNARQSGKSAAMSIKIAECALEEKEPGDYLVIAFTERQAYALFFKVLLYLEDRYPNQIKRGINKPTMHEINLKNGITINCYAAGLNGDGLRHWTLKRLFIDEAAPMNREVFVSVMPMLSVTGGIVDMASTPRGKEGYFYECSDDPALGEKIKKNWRRFYISAEDCPRHSKEFLESEKASMSSLEYSQEYLAVFLDDLRRFFPDNLLSKCITLRRGFTSSFTTSERIVMGCDIARMGEDQGTYEIFRLEGENLIQLENNVTKKQRLNETYNKILELDQKYKFEKIYLDPGGIGVGVFDFLLMNEQTKYKVVDLDNNRRTIDAEGKRSVTLLKEDLYNNLLMLMEQGKINFLIDDDLIESFKSVQFEYVIQKGEPTRLRIFGTHSQSHIVEGIIRAAWFLHTKSLKLWAAWS
jgi:hypothetical protein